MKKALVVGLILASWLTLAWAGLTHAIPEYAALPALLVLSLKAADWIYELSRAGKTRY